MGELRAVQIRCFLHFPDRILSVIIIIIIIIIIIDTLIFPTRWLSLKTGFRRDYTCRARWPEGPYTHFLTISPKSVPNRIRLDVRQAPEMADFQNIFYQFDQHMWSDRIRLDARQAPELADFGIKTWKVSKLPQCEPKEKKKDLQ